MLLGCVLPKKENYIKGRSYCPDCNSDLSWYELIPVISFFAAKGNLQTL
ncbi:prepilin peptidase [Virgibacillus halophilus]|uniref:Prepilin peptidase n=1 Tax=Tigheibacillus halophilus TaxID=361280 RepID=A0ABU5CDR9_9BACI|nr:prepilin peptidase [Virgibacillus halophilus]